MFKTPENLIVFIFSWGVIVSTLCFCLGNSLIETNLAKELADFRMENLGKSLIIVQKNSLVAVDNFQNPEVKKVIKVIATGYSSSPEETDESPLITASGIKVQEGIVANNLLPFGTEIRIPEIYGDKIFKVEDRMHWRKSYYQIDIWFSSKEEAQDFGAKKTYIEVLEG